MSAQAEASQSIVIAGRAFRRPIIQTNRVTWMWLGFLLMLGLYWAYAIALERIDANIVLIRLLALIDSPEAAASATFPWIVQVLVEMFHPRVLRHFIPVILGWWLSVEAATSLVQVLYDCPDRATARDYLRRQRRRNRPPSGEALAVTPQTLHRLEDESVELRVGGPAVVLLPTGHAGVTEWNSRFARVIGAGSQQLGSFEHVYAIITLHPLERTATNIPLMTKEGINVTTDAHIIFRIDPGEDPQTRNRPFPYDPDAVRKAAYTVSVLPNGMESSWEGAPMGKVRSTLSSTVARYGLDELIFPASEAREPHHSIRNEVEQKVREDLKRGGIQFILLQLGRFEPPPEVSEQYTEYWLANWRKQNRIALASGAASAMQEVEVAYAEAEIAMLQAIVEGVRRAQGEMDDASGYLLALRLVEAMDQMVAQSQGRLSGTGSTREQVMPRLNQLREQLATLESEVRPANPAPPVDRLNAPKSVSDG